MKIKPALLLPVALTLTAITLPLRADDSVPPYHPVAVEADLGPFTGFGGGASWRFLDNLGVRGGVDYFRYSGTHTIKDVSYNASVKLVTEPLTLDVYPWKTHSFHLSLGAAFNENRFSGSANGPFTINGDAYNGSLNLRIKQHLVDPYLSIGGNLFYFDSAHHWAMIGELGAFYTGRPSVSLTSNVATAADLASEQAKVQNFADKLRFWPVLKLGVSFAF